MHGAVGFSLLIYLRKTQLELPVGRPAQSIPTHLAIAD